MAENVGIIISSAGNSAVGAKAANILMNTAHAFIKIDTQNDAGFQTITMIITTDPPEPSGGTDAYTQLYKFKHGYTYIPSLETLFFVSSPPPILTGGQVYSQDSIFLGAHTVDDGVTIYAIADATWVYFICDKFNDGTGHANILTGTNLQITTHVFVEDIGAP